MSWENITTIAQFDGEIPEICNNEICGENSPIKLMESKSINELTAAHPSTPSSLLIESLVQLLCFLLEDDKKVANDSYKAICEQLKNINLIDDSFSMSEFEELRSQYQMQIYKIICAVRGRDIPISLPCLGNKSQLVETCWSRYHREFDEISFIAGGGFGKVFKARHKLDCIEYAVKKIKINSTTIKLCHLAEVKTIASLNHPNIVQYKAAWLEPFVSRNETIDLDSEKHNYTEQTSLTESNSNESSTDDEFSDFIQFQRSTTNSLSLNKNRICEYRNNDSVETFQPKPKIAILYIQMSLCQLTLHKWLKDRNISNNFEEFYSNIFQDAVVPNHFEIVNDIFRQILSGLNYIHSKGIVHHDIKPSNIFLGGESHRQLCVQLGDFGLACPLQNSHRGTPLGTPLYAAPEQLQGECNPKSDIYSLGIILLELLLKFSTDMERVRTIENARNGKLPLELTKQIHSLQLIRSLLANAKSRPNTSELLEAITSINLDQNLPDLNMFQVDLKLKDVKIKELKRQVHYLHENTLKQECEILRLLKELEKKNKEILEINSTLDLRNKEVQRLSELLEKCEHQKTCVL